MAPWIDTHVHLDRYEPAERKALLERAGAANVAVIGVAVDMESSRALAAVDGLRGKVFGIHPTRAGAASEAGLSDLLGSPDVLAVGECGFDAAGPAFDVQSDGFEAQCDLARKFELALVLHINGPGAFEQLQVRAQAVRNLRVIRHYFTGNAAEAAWHRERHHYLSLGNPLRRSPQLAAIARGYPRELLLIETDSYPLPGRTTEPKDVVLIGEALAAIRGWDADEAREQLALNTTRAFGSATSSPGR